MSMTKERLEELRRIMCGIGTAYMTTDQIADAERELFAHIDALEERVEDFENSMRMAADERCTDDERHCACVPYLRIRIIALETELKQSKDSEEMSDGCLSMIRDVLIAVGCQCGPDAHEHTPPYSYDDWIRCAIGRREKELAVWKSACNAANDLKMEAQKRVIELEQKGA